MTFVFDKLLPKVCKVCVSLSYTQKDWLYRVSDPAPLKRHLATILSGLWTATQVSTLQIPYRVVQVDAALTLTLLKPLYLAGLLGLVARCFLPKLVGGVFNRHLPSLDEAHR